MAVSEEGYGRRGKPACGSVEVVEVEGAKAREGAAVWACKGCCLATLVVSKSREMPCRTWANDSTGWAVPTSVCAARVARRFSSARKRPERIRRPCCTMILRLGMRTSRPKVSNALQRVFLRAARFSVAHRRRSSTVHSLLVLNLLLARVVVDGAARREEWSARRSRRRSFLNALEEVGAENDGSG